MLQKLKLHPTSAPAGSKEALEESAAKQIPAMPAGDIVLTQEGSVYAGTVGAPVKLSDVELKAYADSDSTKYTFDIKETLTVPAVKGLRTTVLIQRLRLTLSTPIQTITACQGSALSTEFRKETAYRKSR